MAKKNNNTILWIAGLGIAGYLYYNYTKTGSLLPVVNNTVPGASTAPLQLPPSQTLNNPAPALNTPVSNAPSNLALNTTGLSAAKTDSQGNVMPGQAIAITPGGTPVQNGAGQMMIFTSVDQNPMYLNFEANKGKIMAESEI
jgi:hypothetical protein